MIAKSSNCSSEQLRVMQVVASTRVDHGGMSRSVPAICSALTDHQVEVHLLTGRTSGIKSNIPDAPAVTHLIDESGRFGRWFVGKQFSSRLGQLTDCSSETERCIVHDHGIWLPSNRATAQTARAKSWIRVVSPRGMVSPWALKNGGVKKRLAWNLYQKNDLATATAFHATAELEADELRQIGMKQPIAVIPNGIDLPAQMPQRKRHGGRKRMIFLSRIHPKKGLVNLITAFRRANIAKDWELLLVGPDEAGHRAEIENEIDRLDLTDSVEFFGEVNDSEKWQQLVDADLFVLPSFSENFGIVVAEALAAGLPVITTTGTPWQALAENGIGWWIEPNVEALTSTLSDACAVPCDARRQMGQRGAEWSAAQFQWSGIANQMSQFYHWLIDGGTRPSFVNIA